MALKPIRKKRLFEEIILALEDYIQEGKIKPGERLPSANELSEIFGVSKTAIREALTVLHANGIIESRSGVGNFLKGLEGESIAQRVTKNLLNQNELLEILEFRRGIEIEAAALAAVKATSHDVEQIERAHDELIKANRAGRVGVDEDYDFHYAIIQASQNSIYKGIYSELSEKLHEEISISKMQSAKIPGRFSVIHRQHEEIVKAIKEKNRDKASEAMKKHLISTEQKIWSYLN